MRLETYREANCINTLRFLAAFQVMWGHMITHLDIVNNVSDTGGYCVKVISSVLRYFNGVPIFFFISGYLIQFSIQRSQSAKEYYIKRFWRIYPELWAGILIEIITILIFYKEKIDWVKLSIFAITQGTVLQFWTPEFLRGYGCGTPNGALWTICVTVQFYIIAWLARKLWCKRRLKFWIVSTVVLMIIGACTGIIEGLIPTIIYKLYCQTIVQYLWIFWLGIGAAEYSDILLPILIRYWWVGLGVFALWSVIGIDIYARNYPVFMTTISCMGCLGIAYRFPKINIRTDISYAIFIYHMIIVNIMISIGWIGLKGLLVTVVITLLLAYLSTISVGKWAQQKKYQKVIE